MVWAMRLLGSTQGAQAFRVEETLRGELIDKHLGSSRGHSRKLLGSSRVFSRKLLGSSRGHSKRHLGSSRGLSRRL